MDLKMILEENEKLKKIIAKKDAELNQQVTEINKQAAIIFNQQTEINKLVKENQSLHEKYLSSRTKPFLKKNEKLATVVVNEPEEVIKQEKKESKDRKKLGRKEGGKNFKNINLEQSVTETIYENPDISSCSTCNSSLVSAGQKERYTVEVIPATIKVIKIIKRTCKCPNCSKKDNKIYYPISKSPFPGSILTPSFAAYIAYTKYELGIPFHHLERHLSNHLKADISKQLLSTWMMNTSNLLKPLFEKMKDDLKNNSAKVIHADETTLVVSKQPFLNKERKTSYVYVYSTSYYDNQIQIYDFHESRAIDKTAKWLNDYQGYIVCDDYSGYTKLAKINKNIKLQRCWAHVRRRFVDILKNVPPDKQKGTIAFKILELIGKLFKLESQYHDDLKTPSEIVLLREQDQRGIIKQIEELIFNTAPKPNSLLKGALKYAKMIWCELLTYFESGYIELSNNNAERAIKPFVINRKVFMTAGSYAGASCTTTLFSIIRTALINRLDIEQYLIYILENIKEKPIEDLLPYSLNLPSYLKSKI